MQKIFRPMLSAKAESLAMLRYPVLATPKIDGIRCLTINPQILTHKAHICDAVSRNLKQIPNQYIWGRMAADLPPGLDGELITGTTLPDGKFEEHKFNEVSSNVMSNMGFPDFRYIVFDCGHNSIFSGDIPNLGYQDRVEMLLSKVQLPDYCVKLLPVWCKDLQHLMAYEAACLEQGYEGVMIRTPDSPYKFGRSTLKEQWLVKIKRFQDSEAEVIGWDELMHNDNPIERSAIGAAERSSHQENMVPAGTLGAFRVRDLSTRIEFSVGTGYSASQRQDFWNRREFLMGSVMKYRHQPHGTHEAPRFPVFLGWRDGRDM